MSAETTTMNDFSRLFESEAKWGEEKAMAFRWVLLVVILVLISYIFIQGHHQEAVISLVPIVLYLGYNIYLKWLLKQHILQHWVPYLSVTLDISVLSLHLFAYSALFCPIGVTTAASAFIYPILIMLAVLRYNRKLVIYATLYTIFSYNLVYYLRYPHIDPALMEQVVSSDPAGHFYRSIYLGIFGFFMLNIPAMIDRLVARQVEIQTEKNHLDLNLALEKQKKTLALQRLDTEKDINKLLSDQKAQITQRNEELHRVNATKDKLFSIIGHDLRNPLAVQKSLAHSLLADIDSFSKEDLTEALSIILRSAESGYDLLTNLLQWARSQSAGLKFTPKQVSIFELLTEITDSYKDTASQKEVTVKMVKATNGQDQVFADENMLRTILRNLLVNAIKFSHRRGIISIQVDFTDTHTSIAISDQGVGMDENRLQRLFKTEHTRSTTGTANEQGTGLGLILCKEFVEHHGGTITVDSKKGEGSTFSFTLPLANLNIGDSII